MSLVVDFRVSGGPIELPEAAAAVPGATFEIEQFKQDDGLVEWYIWVDSAAVDRVTDAFEALSNAETVTVLNDAGGVSLYRVAVVPKVETPPTDLLSEGMLTEGYVEPDCLRLRSRVTSREVISRTWQYLRERDMRVSIDGLRRATDDDIGRLTEPQFEALVTAFEMGYFDSPKRATHDEVAAELGIARSSLSERLRRAERRLISEQFGREPVTTSH